MLSGRRSGRMPALSSPAALLDEVALAHRAITAGMAGLAISGAHYAALDAARVALDRLAADLGHAERFTGRGHSTPSPRS